MRQPGAGSHAKCGLAGSVTIMNRTVPHDRRTRIATSYALLLPSSIGVGAFLLVPIAVVLWLSLHSWNLLGPIEFTGLDNWRAVLTDRRFGHSVVVTLALTALVVPAQTVLGFTVGTILRVVYALPWMCAPVAIGVAAIPREILDAGALDGATGLPDLRHR